MKELDDARDEALLRRADAARGLVRNGELEPIEALEVVVCPPTKLLELEAGADEEPSSGNRPRGGGR